MLVALPRRAGYDVQKPADLGIGGADDPVHFTHAVLQDRVLLSHNYRDFEQLHDLVMAAGGHHPGILIVHKDNDKKRDLLEFGRAIPMIELQCEDVCLAAIDARMGSQIVP